MKNKIFIIVGAALLVIATAVLIVWQWGIRSSQKRAEAYVDTLCALMPEPQAAPVQERRDNAMPILSLDGKDFVGILEMPRYGSALPVCADWGEVGEYPCRFEGSVYDRTIKIGATTQQGQYDFYREISVGDAVFFTDMEGNRYTYTVTDIRCEKSADRDTLQREEAALTLFIKNVYALEYIVIFCNVST